MTGQHFLRKSPLKPSGPEALSKGRCLIMLSISSVRKGEIELSIFIEREIKEDIELHTRLYRNSHSVFVCSPKQSCLAIMIRDYVSIVILELYNGILPIGDYGHCMEEFGAFIPKFNSVTVYLFFQ
jgi:hypothetical protein